MTISITSHLRLAPLLLAGITTLLATHPLQAQTRVIDLTGRPNAKTTAPFSAVSHAIELGSGRLVLVDGIEVAIRVADFSRDSVWTPGRTGAGPGEYRAPTQAISDGKGGALIPDGALGRAVIVSAAGDLAGTGYTRQELGGIQPTSVRGIDPLGRVLHYGRPLEGSRDSLPIARWDPKTRRTEVLAWWPMVPVTLGPVIKGANGEVSRSISTPSTWPERTAWVAFPDGSIAVVRPAPYRVDVVSANGQLHRGQEVKYSPVVVTAAQRDATRAERGPMPDGVFPAVLPPFEGLDDVIAAPTGEVWVGRMRAWNDSMSVYDIFDKSGNRVARAKLAPRSTVIGIGRASIYVARQSADDDLWYLERFGRR